MVIILSLLERSHTTNGVDCDLCCLPSDYVRLNLRWRTRNFLFTVNEKRLWIFLPIKGTLFFDGFFCFFWKRVYPFSSILVGKHRVRGRSLCIFYIGIFLVFFETPSTCNARGDQRIADISYSATLASSS